MKQFTIGVFGDDKWCHQFVKKIFKEKKINIKFICGRYKTNDQKKISKSFSYYKKRKEGDEIIDWSKKLIEIYNFIRGLSFPGPIAKSYINKKKISIMESLVLDLKLKTNERPGTILNIKKNKIFVKTIDGKVLCINKWLSSYSNKLKVGDIFL